MTADERVESLHTRMEAMKRVRERRKTGLIGAASAALALCLIFLVFSAGGSHIGGSAGMYSGSMMLFEGAGGYVLIALVAFMAGVLITALLIKKKNRKEDFPSRSSTGITNGKE